MNGDRTLDLLDTSRLFDALPADYDLNFHTGFCQRKGHTVDNKDKRPGYLAARRRRFGNQSCLATRNPGISTRRYESSNLLIQTN